MCHNRKCCNPDHLELGDDLENMLDRCRAGRTAKGEWHGKSKRLMIYYGNRVFDFESFNEASDFLGVKHQTLSIHLKRHPDGEWKRFGITKMRVIE